jgi:hypothetical protein
MNFIKEGDYKRQKRWLFYHTIIKPSTFLKIITSNRKSQVIKKLISIRNNCNGSHLNPFYKERK